MSSSSTSVAAKAGSGKRLQIGIVGFLGALVLRLLGASLRWASLQEEHRGAWGASGSRMIIFWHGRQLMMPFLWRLIKTPGAACRMYTMISQHADGRMIARAVNYLGVDSVAGSSSRGAREASLELIEKLRNGHHAAITPDGPRGPARELKLGVVKIARIAGVPIYPAAFASDRRWSFSSWDSMILPKPFARGVFLIGEPISVPASASAAELEQYRLRLQDALNEVTDAADRYEYR